MSTLNELLNTSCDESLWDCESDGTEDDCIGDKIADKWFGETNTSDIVADWLDDDNDYDDDDIVHKLSMSDNEWYQPESKGCKHEHVSEHITRHYPATYEQPAEDEGYIECDDCGEILEDF